MFLAALRLVACRSPEVEPGAWEPVNGAAVFTRGHGEQLQTAVVRYRSANGGPVLLLAGTWHVGAPAYYDALERTVERADLVLSETIRSPRDTAVGERVAPPDLRLVWRYQRAVASLLDWRLQADWERSIADDRWRALDLSWRGQAEALGGTTLLDEAQRAAVARWEALSRGEGLDAEIETARERLRATMGRGGGAAPPPAWESARNEAIFAGVREAVTRGGASQVALLHGPAHLRALAPRLEAELGYVAEAALWLDVAAR